MAVGDFWLAVGSWQLSGGERGYPLCTRSGDPLDARVTGTRFWVIWGQFRAIWALEVAASHRDFLTEIGQNSGRRDHTGPK